MTRSTTKKLTEPLDEPEREFCMLRRAAWRQQQNESLAIARKNLFYNEASSSNNTGTKPLISSKTLQEHSLPSLAGFQNPITLPAEQTGRIDGEGPQSTTFFHPSKSSSVPFPSRLKKQKKDDDDERLLSIFKKININLPFLKAMIHMPKGANVLKYLLSDKEKLEKATSSVKLSEECSAVIQRSLPQKEGDPGSFTLPCLIGPLTVKNALADLGASFNLMPYSLFRRLGISKLKPARVSIQLADRSIKYPIRVCENLLVKINKFIFPVDFVVLEMDEDELIPIILGRPFLATARAVIDVHEGKLSLRPIREQWVDTVDHDGEWIETKEGRDSDDVRAVSFYPMAEPDKPLEWKAPENRLKPLGIEPPKLELKELPKNLEYAFLQEDNQLPVVIASALSATEKARLLKILLLQELDIGIGDKKGVENLAADHLSRLENPDLGKLTKAEIRDLFPEEQLMTISDKGNEPWYVDYANYLTKSYEDASLATRRPKSFDNVTAAHWKDIMGSPQLQGKSLKLDSTGLISFAMHTD
ncbi:DNA-directed DNA polymerase [Tanacetum coccineum]